jgi:hypothetical protein
MTLRDLIEREYRLRYDKPFSDLKPGLVDFILACMGAAEAEGPFAEKVRDMRTYQTKYFRHRSKDYLDKSKDLEKEIDLFLAPKKPKVQQGGLF